MLEPVMGCDSVHVTWVVKCVWMRADQTGGGDLTVGTANNREAFR
jgi:hypothetical protein